ncbi:hypothetical protein SRHO_G00257120 [Serrasalmus rhombeus]
MVGALVEWSRVNILSLYNRKTKQLVVDFRRQKVDLPFVTCGGATLHEREQLEKVECTDSKIIGCEFPPAASNIRGGGGATNGGSGGILWYRGPGSLEVPRKIAAFYPKKHIHQQIKLDPPAPAISPSPLKDIKAG